MLTHDENESGKLSTANSIFLAKTCKLSFEIAASVANPFTFLKTSIKISWINEVFSFAMVYTQDLKETTLCISLESKPWYFRIRGLKSFLNAL